MSLQKGLRILKPIFSSVTLSGGRSSTPLRDLSVWHDQCRSLLMSDGRKTRGRRPSLRTVALHVCQEGPSEGGSRGAQALLARLGYFLPHPCLAGFVQILLVRHDVVSEQISQSVCSEELLLLLLFFLLLLFGLPPGPIHPSSQSRP